jgi:Neutral/alkaline non-lysosomal ceramidase, N-terminal
MKSLLKRSLFNMLFLMILSSTMCAELNVGVAIKDLTPPIGTPSAGYFEREGRGMVGIHDPLLATALVIDNGSKIIAFCSVDHMGFLYRMTQHVITKVQSHPQLQKCEIFIGSSHTHSGGGAYFDIPIVGEMVAGPYDEKIAQFYIDTTADAIIDAFHNLQPAKVGIGYGHTKGLNSYNGVWPKEMPAPSDITIIKATKLDGSPLAVFFNTSIYPAVLEGDNMLFSADVVGYIRQYLSALLGKNAIPVFFNGTLGDIETNAPKASDRFESCNIIGKGIAQTIAEIWNTTNAANKMEIATFRDNYLFEPKPTLSGFQIPTDPAPTEINLIVLNQSDAFITIPAELSCVYDPIFKDQGKKLGFKHISISNLVNDAHGYIYTPEAWQLNPPESDFSFGGRDYGQLVEEKVLKLMKAASKENR